MKFTKPVVLVGGGAVNEPVFQRYISKDYSIIAADGGANYLHAKGVGPQAIIGDMDSTDGEISWPPETKLLQLDEQETTDFEKCLYSIDAPLLICFGFLDGRIDHTLATFHAITKYRDLPILLYGLMDKLVPVSSSIRLKVKSGDRVSIFPLTPCKFISSQGLKYPLDGLVLDQGAKIGTSNEATSSQVDIRLKEGSYALILASTKTEDPYTKLDFISLQ